ncbi:MAG: adenylyltransferase/cytidyltransferase family protein [Candidatus Thermoplasmatota archaeon]|nr:adenylyltransferase/cytidyltransferase family protein [Candidatus Thermoplasmatota archaeon]
MEPALIVLGRFQPFHNGHASMISAAFSHLGVGGSDMPLRICIGSSEAEQSLDNPWSAEEREQMIRIWLDGWDAEIVHVPDLGDPPNYVQHAEKFHGPPGVIFTTDEDTSNLYRSAGWSVIEGVLANREDWQGWRIRATMQMLSTVVEEEAAIAALSVNMPESVVHHIFENGWQRRLFHMGTGGEPVG